MSVQVNGNVAYLESSNSVVFFSKASTSPVMRAVSTPLLLKELVNALKVAPWGEDNRFPQNISNLLDYCGVPKSALDFKARALWGGGILPCKITGYDDAGTEILQPLDRSKYKELFAFIEDRKFYRFYLEFLSDWTMFSNCFPEIVLQNDGKKITRLVHQESCDCRFKQMNEKGEINTVYLSKMWGMAKDQFVKFDKDKRVQGIVDYGQPQETDGKYMKKLTALDMYDPLESLKSYVKDSDQRNFILPVNYPSSNKTYYQLAIWDGARLGGWVDIAASVPAMLKIYYKKAFKIKYHIEIPESYWKKTLGVEVWNGYDADKRLLVKKELLESMDKFLSGEDNAYKSFVSFFDVSVVDGAETGRIKITAIEDKVNIDKELMTGATANGEILFAMGINPDIIGAGVPGSSVYGGSKGGSNIREGKLVYDSTLALERQVILEPLYLVRDYNQWGDDIQFRMRDVVLTTLDKNTGTEKKVS
jgi:hypothetical protein